MFTNMKTLIYTLLATWLSICAADAQGMKPFDPAKFQADLEQFITVEACLTPSEAAAFFPLYREMLKKQRALYEQMRDGRHGRPDTEEAARKAISENDRIEIEIKQLQANYHARFISIISAKKLYNVIKAEGKFHRMAMKRAVPPRR